MRRTAGALWVFGMLVSAAMAADALPGGAEEIVFAVRSPANYHYYENFGEFVFHVKQAYAPAEQADAGPPMPLYGSGGRLCRLNVRTGELKVLLDDPQGAVRDPQVDYDGRRILFSYRPAGDGHYHLYEIQSDGTGLVQLTEGAFDDIEPTYTPDGSILFCSSRCRRYVGCNPSPVATLYRCDADGENIELASASPFTENTPWMLADGRVLFTRWEYVDRNQLSFHHLWAMRPDGSGVAAFFGNQFTGTGTPIPRFSDVAMLDAKPIPGTQKIVASFSPDHGRGEHLGYVTLIDPQRGPDAMAAARRIHPTRMFRDPFPLSEDLFLVADAKGIWTLNGQGEVQPLFALPTTNARLECHEPRPLVARPREPAPLPQAEPRAPTGRLLLADAYRGRNLDGIRPGDIRRLLILEQLPKPAQFSGGQEPLTIGGPFTLTRILGTVPVEPDGSAYFEVPARRSFFFAALDADGLAVKRMQSFVSVMPGETISCVGCHESRQETPSAQRLPLAAARSPSPIEPIADVPEVFDFPRDIQPILDRHCTECHNADRLEGRVDLSGDRTPMYSQSYDTLIARGLVSDGRNFTGNSPPRTLGSSASRLLKLADGSHFGAKLTDRERLLVRLWIDSGATYPGTYAALGTGMALVQFPVDRITRRCAGCHQAEPEPYVGMPKGAMHLRFGSAEPAQVLSTSLPDFLIVRRLAYYKPGEALPHQERCNLSQPEKSLFLRAPLARAAGGLGLCKGDVFADTTDADYQTILSAIRAASAQLEQEKRFDMPGFRPNKYYVRLMQEYGILPATHRLDDAVDPYALEQQYWASLQRETP